MNTHLHEEEKQELVVAGMALAPFSPEQVASLNAYQAAGLFHPFTCAHDSAHLILLAEIDGWRCLDCDYTQNWAHAWMADWSWRGRRADAWTMVTRGACRVA